MCMPNLVKKFGHINEWGRSYITTTPGRKQENLPLIKR